MNLLAIPNDPTSAYHRSSRKDFLGEFNPNGFVGGVEFFN